MLQRFAGRYELLKRLGEGGMGEVFLARDLTTGAECALKRLSRQASTLAALRREFEAPVRLRHPAVVQVFELGVAPDGTPYYTMEYVPGQSADRAIARGDWSTTCFLAAEVAHALEALHAVGVIHGDLKPSNVLIVPGPSPHCAPSSVRLLDFGLAALRDDTGQGHRGTAGYAAPEVVRGEAPGTTADLYGLGSTLYTLIAGRPAFEGHDVAALLRLQQKGPPSSTPLEDAGAPAELTRLILRLLAPEPGERPRDAREVRREIESIHPDARRPLVERLRSTVVVGRERELATLEQGLARPSRRPRVIQLKGVSGIGKSAVLREFAARAALAGRRVVTLTSGLFEGPGATAIALLRRLATEAEADAAAFPTLASGDGLALAGADAELDEAHAGPLLDAAIGWIAAIAGRSGSVVILLDECDRLDPISRAFLRRLAFQPAGGGILWVAASATGRGEAASLPIPWSEAIELGSLERDGAQRLIEARLRAPAPESLCELLWERAQGHPGLTVEWLLYAAAKGALREGESGLIADPESLRALGLPESFEGSLDARIRDLPAPVRRAAAALAVLRNPSDPVRVRALAAEATDESLAALVEAGLATRDSMGRAALVSHTLAERILESFDPGDRRAFHRAALAETGLLESERFFHLRGAGDPHALAAAESAYAVAPETSLTVESADYADSAGLPEAAAWRERAGRSLSKRGRYHEAIAQLERAIDLAPPGDASPERWLLLSTAYLRVGRLTDVARAVARALEGSPTAAIESRLLTNESGRLLFSGELESGRAAAERALALAESAADDEALGAAAQSLVYSLLALGRHDDADRAALRSAEAYRRTGATMGWIRALGARAAVAHARQRLGDAERLYDEALATARRHGIRLGIEEVLNNLSVLYSESGQWEKMRKANAEASRLALEDHRPRGAAVATTNLAHADGLAGRPRSARRQARLAIRLARSHAAWLEASAWRSLAQALRIQGGHRRAERAARRALELAMARGLKSEADWCRIEYGRILCSTRRWKEAGDLIDRSLNEPHAEGSVARTALLALSGRAALRRGDHALAASREASANEWIEHHDAPYAAALVAQLRAELALVQGRASEGVQHAERALAGLLALPAPADRAMAALEFAHLAMSVSTEMTAPVGDWLELAAASFERLGDRRSRERALGHLVQWLRASPPLHTPGRRDRTLIESVSELLHSLSDLRELTHRAMQMVVEQLDAECGVLLLMDPESGRLEPIAEYGAVDASTRREAVGYSRRVVQRVTESGGSLLIGDAPSDPHGLSESMVDLKLRSIVCVPMFVAGRLIGAVYLDDSRRSLKFSDSDRSVLEGFAQLMGVAIEKSQGHEEVQRANEILVGENLSLRQEAMLRFQSQRLIGSSHEMQRVLAIVERAALTHSTVLLTGENGTGKELVARILHHSGKRRLRPFVAVNCGAIPETLLESELFGILPSVATGVRGRDGRFKQADRGTLFLDEIGDMPLRQQVALLGVIANREITPVGGGKPIPVDVRIIAATNRDIRRLVADGAFREDLYYRLNVIEIEIPALRDRKADIPALAQHFAQQFAHNQEREAPQLSAPFMAALMQSDWPGNVRELQNYIERVMAMNPGNVLEPNPMPRDLEERQTTLRLGRGRRLTELVEDLERRLVEEALSNARGNQSMAARELGVPEQAIRYRIKKYGILSSRENRRIRLKWR